MLHFFATLFGRDRRLQPRHPCRLRVTLGVPGRRSPIGGTIRNISTEGFLFTPHGQMGFVPAHAVRLTVGEQSFAAQVQQRSAHGLHCRFVRPLSQEQLAALLRLSGAEAAEEVEPA